MIILAGAAHVGADKIDDFLVDAKRSEAWARQAEGNQAFFCAITDAEAGSLLLYERWTDQGALDAYLARPEVQAVFEKWGPSMTNEVRKFTAKDERDPMAP